MVSLGPFAKAAASYARAGIATIPCDADKQPLVSGWNKWKGPALETTILRFVEKFPNANIAALPGASRGGLICVDIDDPDLTREMWQRFGPTPLVIETPSGGRHFWYRGRARSANLRQSECIPVDIKSQGSIVLMPPSRRATGAYTFLLGDIDDIARLPTIRRGSLAAEPPLQGVAEGRRNTELFKALRSMVRGTESLEMLLERAHCLNATYRPPLGEQEVAKTTASVWAWYLKHPKGAWKHGHLLIRTTDIFELDSDALKLYLVLKAAHDNDSGRARDGFAISPKAMWREGTIPGWGRGAYTNARDALLECGRLSLVSKARRGRPALYRLTEPLSQPATAGGRGE